MKENFGEFYQLEEEVPDEADQLSALARVIQFSNGFSLVFAVCNDIEYRESLIAQIQAKLAPQNTRILRLASETQNLLTVLAGEDLDSVQGLFVLGIEGWLGSGTLGEQHPFILNLNATRNAFPGAFHGTLVLWVPQYLLSNLHRGAPDFFSVRSGIYTFGPSEAERSRLATELTQNDWWSIVGLSLAEKEDNIERLEKLLSDLLSAPEDQQVPSTIARIHFSLADTYRANGLFSKALANGSKALKIRQELYGELHPDTWGSMSHLAATYSDVGQHEKALVLKVHVLKLLNQIYDIDPAHTCTIKSNLAQTYSALGRNDEAVTLKEEVLAFRRVRLGEDHPDTIISLSNLAATYGDLGRHSEALGLKQEALTKIGSALGKNHPSTLTCMNNLAVSFLAVGRLQDAQKLFEETLALRKCVLGDRHPDTLVTISNLAIAYSRLGRQDLALSLKEEALSLMKAEPSELHPDTLAGM